MIWNLGRTSGRADNDSLQSGHVWPRHAETCWSCGVWSRNTQGRSTSPRPNDRFGTKLLLPHHLREKFGPSIYFRCYGLLWVLPDEDCLQEKLMQGQTSNFIASGCHVYGLGVISLSVDFQSVSSWDILPALGTVKAACV